VTQQIDFEEHALAVGQAFSPAAPIREKDVFAGRKRQICAVVDAINQPGQHVIIYGERGVGKTSLANVVDSFVLRPAGQGVIAPHINCDASDDFTSIWRKLLDQVAVQSSDPGFGFSVQPTVNIRTLSDQLPDRLTPREVLIIARQCTSNGLFVPIIDEFDRLDSQDDARLLADTVKALSDQNPKATVILVGVADTVDTLISEHQSIERALVQIRMPRMTNSESLEILNTGARHLSMSFAAEAAQYVVALSLGLPHYTHLLGLHACRSALNRKVLAVSIEDVQYAIREALSGAQQRLQRDYHTATSSPRKDNLYEQALLACALADVDELGYFAAADVRTPMCRIMGKPYEIPQFSQHLNAFCEEARGPVLERTGVPRRYRFRFRTPLLQPYVIMKGVTDQRVTSQDVILLQERRSQRRELDLG
jgi:Cdc6-like AAA superfamily ATPase